jgi:hypothetical protein
MSSPFITLLPTASWSLSHVTLQLIGGMVSPQGAEETGVVAHEIDMGGGSASASWSRIARGRMVGFTGRALPTICGTRIESKATSIDVLSRPIVDGNDGCICKSVMHISVWSRKSSLVLPSARLDLNIDMKVAPRYLRRNNDLVHTWSYREYPNNIAKVGSYIRTYEL